MKGDSRKKGKRIRITPDWKWIGTTFGMTIGISSAMSFLSNEVLSAGGMALSFVVLLVIVLIGIVFDIIGMSVTAADEKPFHSMAAKKVPEAAVAIRLIRRAYLRCRIRFCIGCDRSQSCDKYAADSGQCDSAADVCTGGSLHRWRQGLRKIHCHEQCDPDHPYGCKADLFIQVHPGLHRADIQTQMRGYLCWKIFMIVPIC